MPLSNKFNAADYIFSSNFLLYVQLLHAINDFPGFLVAQPPGGSSRSLKAQQTVDCDCYHLIYKDPSKYKRFSAEFERKLEMETAGTSSYKKTRKLRQCSGKFELGVAVVSTFALNLGIPQFAGDSTRSEPTEASSESEADPHYTHGTKKKHDRHKQTGLKFSTLAYDSQFDDGEHRSAFLPYKVSIFLLIHCPVRLD